MVDLRWHHEVLKWLFYVHQQHHLGKCQLQELWPARHTFHFDEHDQAVAAAELAFRQNYVSTLKAWTHEVENHPS
jgi:hypothetical protein